MSKRKTQEILCHPERKRQGRGLCGVCYMKWYKTNFKDRVKATEKKRNQKRSKDPAYLEKKYLAGIKRKYGVTAEQYEAMIRKSNGTCHVCSQEPVEGKRLHVDHCHDTGKVRGLLCAQCNWFAGKIDKVPNILMRLFIYERKWTEI